MFMGGRWFRTLNECITFSEVHIPEGQLQWFIDIVAYLEFITGNKVSPRESHLDYMHAAKVRNAMEQSKIIYHFKIDTSSILGGLSKVKDYTIPLTKIRNLKLWNTRDGVRGLYFMASKYLQYQRLNVSGWH